MAYKLLKEQVDIPAGEVFNLEGEEYTGEETGKKYPRNVVEGKPDFFILVSSTFQPVEGELCFRFNEQGKIVGTPSTLSEEMRARIEFGNCFKSEQEAQIVSDKVKEFLHKPDLLQSLK